MLQEQEQMLQEQMLQEQEQMLQEQMLQEQMLQDKETFNKQIILLDYNYFFSYFIFYLYFSKV